MNGLLTKLAKWWLRRQGYFIHKQELNLVPDFILELRGMKK